MITSVRSAQLVLILSLFVVSIGDAAGCKSKSSAPSSEPVSSVSTASVSEKSSPDSAAEQHGKKEDKHDPQTTLRQDSSPVSAEQVEQVLNPSNLPEYTGPTGIVEGTVRIKGDPAPKLPVQVAPGCEAALAMYQSAFREGPGRAVADVLVAVTGYEGYVPQKRKAVTVSIENCAFSKKTIAMTFGQRLEVQNIDRGRSYVPSLKGARSAVLMVAVSMGDPVRLYAEQIGRYLLVDTMNRPWMSAEVLVVKFPTHEVTGIDGRYRIEGIPVGQVSVNAWLPDVDLQQNKSIEIKADKVTKVDFELVFDQNQFATKQRKINTAMAESSGSPNGPAQPVIK